MKTLAVFIVVLLYSVTLSSQERITLLFVGDLMQHQAQIDAAHVSEGKYDYSSCFSLIKEQISQADLAIGNLEVTLGGRPYRGYPMFSAPDEYLQAIKDAGFDILLTANNHCLDRGKKGMERTILIRILSCKISKVPRHANRMPLLPACIGERNISPFPTVSNANWPTGCSNKA